MGNVLFRVSPFVKSISLTCLLLSTATLTVTAQASRTLSSTGRRLDDFNRQAEKAERDELAREMHGRKPTQEQLRETQLKKAQIKEDFESLQTSYNDIITRIRAKESLSNSYIAGVTGKISKSGSRLLHNIDFPAKKADAPKGDAPSTPVSTLKTLCFQLHAFLTSPIFETGVLDLVESERARDALEKVIHTAERVRQQLGKID